MKIIDIKIAGIWLVSLLLFGCGGMLSQSKSASPEDRLILVTGITGNQGGGVANALLDQGFRVRGLSRNIQSDVSNQWASRGVEMVQADFTDYESIRSAVQGVDGMFLNITEQTPDFIEAANNAIDAAYAAGAGHIVFTSNIPANPESGFNHNPERTKRMIELHLRDSGKSYTTLRIPFLMENIMRERDMRALLSTGVVDYGTEGTLAYYMNSGDMGLLAAAAFADPQAWNGREVNMASDALTYRELSELLARLSGLDIPYRVAPWSEMNGPFVANFQFFETLGPEAYDLRQVRSEFPQVRSLEQYLLDQDFGPKLRALAGNDD